MPTFEMLNKKTENQELPFQTYKTSVFRKH